MVVNPGPDSEVTAETKVDEIDGGGTTCFMSVEIENRVPPIGELPPKTTAEIWVADSGCSQFMAPFVDYMINYCEGGGVVRVSDGRAMPIEGIWSSPMSFRSS